MRALLVLFAFIAISKSDSIRSVPSTQNIRGIQHKITDQIENVRKVRQVSGGFFPALQYNPYQQQYNPYQQQQQYNPYQQQQQYNPYQQQQQYNPYQQQQYNPYQQQYPGNPGHSPHDDDHHHHHGHDRDHHHHHHHDG